MNYLNHATRALVERVFGLLELFDPSFFVSGAAFVAALLFADLFPGSALLLGLEDGNLHRVPALGWTLLTVASYVAGLACFSLGRSLRRKGSRWVQGKPKESPLLLLFEDHGLLRIDGERIQISAAGRTIPWLERYLDEINLAHQEKRSSARIQAVQAAIYVRMWAELRKNKSLAPSFSLLRRYWVSAATLDGLFVAGMSWTFALAHADYGLGAAASFVGALLALLEARRYELHQRNELVATLTQAYDERAFSD